ncbi:hypothetical protein [Thiococcus pfennigii]|uniref:hypothetical protein n=1 Tax=Thiococcus pfennigii TaxID=1057 RepID=UPI001F5B3901|nr:hypothetical protein [Thiococcus pfennigii]
MSKPAPPTQMPIEPAPDRPLLRLWSLFWNSVVRVLWLCAYATVASIAVAYLFLANGQGQDLLRLSAERGLSGWNLAFLAGALLLGLTLWYTARRLLDREFPGRRFNRRTSAFGRRWLPRLFGFVAPLSIGVGFLRVDTDQVLAARVLGIVFLALAAGLMWFFIARRRLFVAPDRARLGLEVANERGLSPLDWTIIVSAFAAAALLLVAFVVWPVALPQALGAPAVVLLGLAGIALFGGLILTYAFLARGQPAGTALVLMIAVVSGFFNDNHWVRTEPDAPPLTRTPPAAHYADWRRANPAPIEIDGRPPLVLVATAGGGIRAAYWTASSLAVMESIPGFSANLFAISGVSGGSVGAAVYAAVKRAQLAQGAGSTEDIPTRVTVQQALREDFLSPVVAGMLFPDLMQRFIPYPVPLADRQRFLELSFQQALANGDSALGRPMTALYGDGFETRLPSLLLNTTVVGSGYRGILSNIDLAGFSDALDLLGDGYSTRDALLSAAAGASARFTYVSPAGSLKVSEREKDQKIRVVDGGYFDNSGATTALELLDQIGDSRVFPILVLISNSPQGTPICQGRHSPDLAALKEAAIGPPADDFLSEVLSPVLALLNARTASERRTEVEAAKLVEEAYGGAVIEISLASAAQIDLAQAESAEERAKIRRAMVEPPLGWSLSEAAWRYMDDALDTEGTGLAIEFDNLRAVLAGRIDDYRKCRAQ